MRLRVVICEDEPAIRRILQVLAERRGYEVLTFPDPAHCPLYVRPPCPCPAGAVCADFLLVDRAMPEVEGLAFVERLRATGCRVPQIALLSGAWPPAARTRAQQLGCRLFPKPFELPALLAWFTAGEAQVNPTRVLWDWGGPGAAPVREASLPPGDAAQRRAPNLERRQVARLPVPPRLRRPGRDAQRVCLYDLSLAGARIAHRRPLPDWSIAFVELPPGLGSGRLQGEVIWSQAGGRPPEAAGEGQLYYQSGLAFICLTPEQRDGLAQALTRLQAAQETAAAEPSA